MGLVRAKKGLGQNFLCDRALANRIVSVHRPKKEEIHLEIGAGQGELTSLLAGRVGLLYAVELDRELLPGLRDRLKGKGNVSIIEGDILSIDIKNLVFKGKPEGKKLRVIGNLPYNIATKIITHLLSYKELISDLTLTLQKELAQRMTAHPATKDYGFLSLFIQYHLEPRIRFLIPRKAFYPQPKVESALVQFRVRETPQVEVTDEAGLFRIIRISFAGRRKTIENNLIAYLKSPREKVRMLLLSAGIAPHFRAEQLDISDFARLLGSISKEKKAAKEE
jgi:16S rRNA (adenine1518-N6/adenine1519-N6)-dimethyltransferase